MPFKKALCKKGKRNRSIVEVVCNSIEDITCYVKLPPIVLDPHKNL